MRFTLEIDCDNAAFDPDPAEEVGRILRHVAEHLESMAQGYPMGVLRDANGNRVGRWALSD